MPTAIVIGAGIGGLAAAARLARAGYRVHFEDGSAMDLSPSLPKMREQLDALEPGSFEQFLRFMADGYRHYKLSLKHFVGRDFDGLLDYFSPRNLPLIFSMKALTTHAKNTARHFKDPRLQAAFSFQNMYL